MSRVTQPTIWHRITLEKLSDGWELVVSRFADGKRRVYWRKLWPGSTFYDTMECSSSKLRQMQFMVRRGWIRSINENWEITEEGRKYMVSKV